MDNLEMLKMMAAREAFIVPVVDLEATGLKWSNLLKQSPYLSAFSEMRVVNGKATNQSAQEVHCWSPREDG